jgi:hypothetical protein
MTDNRALQLQQPRGGLSVIGMPLRVLGLLFFLAAIHPAHQAHAAVCEQTACALNDLGCIDPS